MLSVTQTISNKKIILIIGVIFFTHFNALANPEYGVGVIKANRLSVRKEAGRNKALIKILEKGDRVTVLENQGRWLKIEHNGIEGYIRNRSRYVTILTEPEPPPAPIKVSPKPMDESSPDNIPQQTNSSQISEEPEEEDEDETALEESTEAQNIQQQIEDHQTEIVELNVHEVKTINKLSELEITINNIRGRIGQIRKEIKKAENRIKEITETIRQVRETIDTNEFYSSKRLSALYKLNRLGTMHILASSTTINDFFRRKKAIENILAFDENLLNTHLENKNRLENLLKQSLVEKKDKVALEKDLEVQLDNLSSERKKRALILEAIQNKRSLALASIESLKQAAAALDQTILSLNVIDQNESKNQTEKKFSDYKGLLKMPVRGKIVADFGPYKNKQFNVTNFRSGIEIGADRGEPVHAVLSGQVLYANWFKGYGNMVIIDHGDNYYTVYAHAEEIFKKRGDQVDVEEVIATVGDTASMVGTSLYFEVRHHGKPLNPLKWLNNS